MSRILHCTSSAPKKLNRASLSLVFSPKFLFLMPLILLMIFFSGCARQKLSLGPPPAPPTAMQTREDVNAVLLREYGGFNSLKASGEIQFWQAGDPNWRSASIALMISRPDKLRARAYRLLSPTLFDFVSDGDNCHLYLPSEQTVYLDRNCGIIEEGEEHFVLSSRIVLASVLVVSDFGSFESAPASITSQGKMVRVSVNEGGKPERELIINPATGLVMQQIFYSPDGAIEADIRYQRNMTVGQSVVPSQVEVSIPQLQAKVRLQLSDAKLNPAIPANAFLFSQPPNARVIDINATPEAAAR